MPTSRDSIQHRLKRIEGQVRGIMTMVEADRDCADVLTQVAAVRAALDSVGSIVIANQVEELVGHAGANRMKLQTLTSMIERFLK
jgi:DNA-binding FrmR family transcriptional regulator